MRGAFFVGVSLLIATLAAGDECKNEEVHNCFQTMEAILEKQFSNLKKTEPELDSFCGEVTRNAKCLTDAPKSCKDSRPEIEAVSKSVTKYLDRFCHPKSEERRMYLEKVPCLLQNHESLQHCSEQEPPKDEGKEETPDIICKEYQKMVSCMTETAKDKCEKPAETLVKYLMEPLESLFSKQCNSGSRLPVNFFLVMLGLFAAFLCS